MRGARFLGLTCATLLLVGAVVAAFIGIIANDLRCDDSCSPRPEFRDLWWYDPNAAQWDTQLWLALGAVGIAIVVLALTIKRRYVVASFLGALTVILDLEWMAILHEGHFGGVWSSPLS